MTNPTPTPGQPSEAMPGPARVCAAIVLLITGLLGWQTVRGLPRQAVPAIRAAVLSDWALLLTYLAIAAWVALFMVILVTGWAGLAALGWVLLVGVALLGLVVRVVRH